MKKAFFEKSQGAAAAPKSLKFQSVRNEKVAAYELIRSRRNRLDSEGHGC
jgi:hypothetical protein